jgi:[acyl-carrier-protein] S-malonyltransferase
MLGAFAAAHEAVRAAYGRASSVLGFDLWSVVAEGPAERLNSTEVTQPAMLVADVVTAEIWRAAGGEAPVAVAGHSLGEFAALVCAGALGFEDAVALVHQRAQCMQEAVPAGAGAMSVVMGLEDEQVAAACAEAAQGEVVEAVNFNAPGQVVIAGHSAAVRRALEAARARGARRAQPIPVSVPAHSSLLREAAQRFGVRLARVGFRVPHCRYVSSVDAASHSDPEDIRALLVRQLASPVRWPQTVRALLGHATTLIESGPGRVLTGLNRRIERSASCRALEDPAALAAALSALAGSAHA